MNHEEMNALKNKMRESQQTKYKENSKSRLQTIAGKKIKTTMIGALDAIEKTFGFLWGLDENGNKITEELTDEELKAKELYDQLRAIILDLGNKQIRNLDSEFANHTVEWNRFHVDMPVL